MRRRTIYRICWAGLGAAIAVAAVALAVERDAPAPVSAPTFHEAPDEARARAEWFYARRAYPAEETPPYALRSAALQARTLRSLAAADTGDEVPDLTWASIGPTPLTGSWRGSFGTSPGAGRVPALAPVGDGTTAYLGGAQGGVWKTVDGGTTWTPVFDGVIGAGEAGMAIGALAVDPVSPSTVYAGTGEGKFHERAYFGGGIFKTTNGGATWSKVGGATFDTCSIGDLRIRGTTILAAAIRAGKWRRSCVGGVYRSIDGGTTWSRTLDDTATEPNPTRTVQVGAFDIAPGAGAAWFATVWGNDPAGSGGPVFKSTDDGVTWGRLAGGLRTTDNGRSTVATARTNGSRVYAATTSTRSDNWGNLTGIFVSSDGGATWASRALPNSETEGTPCAGGFKDALHDPLTTPGQCDYDQELIVHPTDPDTVYLAGITLWRSTDAGVTWSRVDGDPTGYDVHLDYHALAFDSAGRFWVGTDGGVWRSANDGADWTNLNATLSLVQFEWGIAGQADADGPIYGGTQDQATNRRNPDGSWQRLLGGDGGAMAWSAEEPNVIYATVYYGYLFKSTDAGNNWEVGAASAGLGSAADYWNFHPPMVMSPSDRATLFFASTRVWQSTDAAENWEAISPHFGGDNRSAISALGATTDPDVIYAGSNDGQLQVSRDATADEPTWTPRSSGLPNRTFTEVEAKPARPERLM